MNTTLSYNTGQGHSGSVRLPPGVQLAPSAPNSLASSRSQLLILQARNRRDLFTQHLQPFAHRTNRFCSLLSQSWRSRNTLPSSPALPSHSMESAKIRAVTYHTVICCSRMNHQARDGPVRLNCLDTVV